MRKPWRDALVLILGCTGIAIALGIAVDLVTANLAVTYFTVHHPKVVESESPWVMALVWGFGASWWAGAIAGGLLAWIRAAKAPSIEIKSILRWVAVSSGVIWAAMMAIVAAVYCVASVVPESQRRPSFESDRRLMAVAMAHQFEYLFAVIALVIVIVKMRRAARA